MIQELTRDTIDKTLTSTATVLVEFGAPWCGPCRMTVPGLERLADEQISVAVATINSDESPELSMRHNVTNLPTLIVFKNGVEVKRHVGALSYAGVKQLVS